MGDYNKYLAGLSDRFWAYRTTRFADEQSIFDQRDLHGMRPPVFLRSQELRNVIVDPRLVLEEANQVRCMLAAEERHRWFGSMKSSQALVQSVFGNLSAMQCLSAIEAISTEEGGHPFRELSQVGSSLDLERRVTAQGEPRPTSIDVWVTASTRVAIECKFTECDVGQCSRPGLKGDDPGHCDGSYRYQRDRDARCVLTTLGVKYWNFVPLLFKWRSDQDHPSCPLLPTYQLVRNVLAASIDENGDLIRGFAVLLYDERNPEFRKSGRGDRAFAAVKNALLEPHRLQRLSWRTVMQAMGKVPRLRWLTSELGAKYGL
jgi:hypothetical protein